MSESLGVVCGVPESIVLGLFLFKVYMMVSSQLIEEKQVFWLVDDTVVAVQSGTKETTKKVEIVAQK